LPEGTCAGKAPAAGTAAAKATINAKRNGMNAVHDSKRRSAY
jgi:hypothetical protein